MLSKIYPHPEEARSAVSKDARSFRSPLFLTIVACLLAVSAPARADESAAIYQAYWAGLPAGEIRLALRDEPGAYHDRIEIRSVGLPSLVTRFRGSAISEGRLIAGRLPLPARFDAAYDLRKRRDRRLSMVFAARGES